VISSATSASTISLSVNGASGVVPVYFGVVAGQQGAAFDVAVTGATDGDQVVLLDGDSQLGPALTLVSGAASYRTQLPVGENPIQAVYIGNASVAGKASSLVTVRRYPRPRPR
jgi:hypothetical protein